MNSVMMAMLPFLARRLALVGLVWIVLITLVALFAPLIAPYDPLNGVAIDRLQSPSGTYLFGTDPHGRDLLSRCIYGAQMAILIGLGSVSVALVAGTAIGTLSAYFPKLGHILMRLVDVLMAFPALLLALVLMAIFQRSVGNTIVVIGLVFTTTTARILYGVALKLKSEVFVEAALCSGASHSTVLLKHILPNLVSPLLVQASFIFAAAQLQMAALDFLGLGLPAGIPSWGNILSESRIYVSRAPWLLLFPGLFIVLTVFSINVVGDVLRDQVDPRYRDQV